MAGDLNVTGLFALKNIVFLIKAFKGFKFKAKQCIINCLGNV